MEALNAQTKLPDNPVPGETYMVPCVRSTWPRAFFGKDSIIRWIPVIGGAHSDAGPIGFDPFHWHADYRFIDLDELAQIDTGHRGDVSAIRQIALESPIPEVVPEPLPGEEEKSYRVQDQALLGMDQERYFRIRPAVYRQHLPAGFERRFTWLPELTQQMRNCRLDETRRCPHQQADLSGIAPDEDGIITCPLHGLRWDTGTGQVAPPLDYLEPTPWTGVPEALAGYHEYLFTLAATVQELRKTGHPEDAEQLLDEYGYKDDIAVAQIIEYHRWAHMALPEPRTR